MKKVGAECYAGFRAHERCIHLTLRGKGMVGAKGFEPSTSWSRTMVIQNLSCWIDLSSLCRPSHLLALRFAIQIRCCFDVLTARPESPFPPILAVPKTFQRACEKVRVE